MTTGTPGQPVPLILNFYNEETGVLTDPDGAITLDITYGEEIGFASDVAGPFSYLGASSYTPGQIWRVSTGVYEFLWTIPVQSPGGVYIANWSVGFQGRTFLAFENFPVTGAGLAPAVPPGDLGFWTGSLTSPDGSVVIPLGGTDDNGIAWLLQHVDGWDSPDVQGAGVIPKSGDHGGWAAPQYYAPRPITLTITASAASQALRDVARATLQEVVDISDLGLFVYNEPVPKQALVRRSGRIPETYPTLADVTFTVGLIAPDPRKYAVGVKTVSGTAVPATQIGITIPTTVPFTLVAQVPGGTVGVNNAGNFETRPVVTISGPITSPALTLLGTGEVVSWTGLVLAAGDNLVVDFGNRQAFLNDSYRPADVFSAWWVLPKGSSTIQLSGSGDASAKFAVAYQDAYM